MTSEAMKKWIEERRLNLIMIKNQKLRLEKNQTLFERGERITNDDVVGQTGLSRRKQPEQQCEKKAEEFLKRPDVTEIVRKEEQEPNKAPFVNETSIGLNLLLSNYADSDNDGGSETEEGEIKSESDQVVTVETKEERVPLPVPEPLVENTPKFKRKKRLQGRRPGGENGLKNKYSETLLKRLLSSEIRHERNSILQCINYIVKNQFFDG